MVKLQENMLAALGVTLERTVSMRIFILYIRAVWDKLLLSA